MKRRWVPVLTCSLLPFMLLCFVCIRACIDYQAEIDALNTPRPIITDFTFSRPVCGVTAIDCETWKVYEAGTVDTITWTIIDNIAGDDGSVIGKGVAGQ